MSGLMTRIQALWTPKCKRPIPVIEDVEELEHKLKHALVSHTKASVKGRISAHTQAIRQEMVKDSLRALLDTVEGKAHERRS